MTPGETEYEGINSWISVPFERESVVYVYGSHGQKDVVLATQQDERWSLLGRGIRLDAGDLPAAARKIALGAAA